jgi:hypothetical protein
VRAVILAMHQTDHATSEEPASLVQKEAPMSAAESTASRLFDYPVLLAAHTPESWARAVIATGVQTLVAAKGAGSEDIAGVGVPLEAKLTVFFRHTTVGVILEFEGKSFAVQI